MVYIMRPNADLQGPLSTALRLLPRLLNFVNPSYLLARLQAPSVSSGTGKTLKITKARRRRVEEMMDLLARAEGDGCEQVWAFKGKMRMVSDAS
jgi:SEL1 protein